MFKVSSKAESMKQVNDYPEMTVQTIFYIDRQFCSSQYIATLYLRRVHDKSLTDRYLTHKLQIRDNVNLDPSTTN